MQCLRAGSYLMLRLLPLMHVTAEGEPLAQGARLSLTSLIVLYEFL